MAYKKYITRGGKVYGPYIYHSRRENGQVITEYRGKKDDKKLFHIFLWIFLGIFILAGLYLIISNSGFFNITGLASLQLATDYKPNESVNGILRLSLTEGELIPKDTSVIVNIAGEERKYILSDLVSGESAEGNYYVGDAEVSGSGLGYGSKGAKYSYPEVSFKLNIVGVDEIPKEIIKETENSNETGISENSSNESNTSETGSGLEERINQTQENSGETTSEEAQPAADESVPTEETSVEQTETSTQSESSSAGITSTITSGITQETQNAVTPTETETSGENAGTEASEKTSESVSTENTGESSTGITGGMIKFLTGLASLNFAQDTQEKVDGLVEGSVVYGKDVKYNLPDGKTAILIEGSVFADGEKIDDSNINIDVKNNFATVSTNYRQAEYGFGKDYTSNEKIYYDINLSKLNLTAKDGRMSIQLVFNDSVLVETSSDLAVSEDELDLLKNISVAVELFTLENSSIYDLTDDEIKLLIRKTGTASVNTTKSEIFNKRLVLKYELGDYWTEFSYDYDGKLSKELLDKIELERKYWLKNLAAQLSKEAFSSENVDDLVVGFNLNDSNNLRIGKENISEIPEENFNESVIVETEAVEENLNESLEIPAQEITEENTLGNATEETPAENSSEVLSNETIQTETPTETIPVLPEIIETQNSAAETSAESTGEIPVETASITGQIVSQPESQTNLFDKIIEFSNNLFRNIREAFS